MGASATQGRALWWAVQNFRPGTLEQWQLGPEQLCANSSALVIARGSGFGQTGPYAHRPSYASVAEAMSGMRNLTGFPGEAPPRTGLSLGNSLAAIFVIQGVLMALYWQYARGGRTDRIIDVWLLESCFALLGSVAAEYVATGSVRQPSGTEQSGLAPSNLFRAADNRWVLIADNQYAIFGRLCAAMDSPDLAREPRVSSQTARSEHQQEIENIVSRWAEQYSSEELARRLDDAGVPSVVVFTVADIFTERDMLLTHNCRDGHPLVMPGIVPKLSGTSGDARWAGGGVGPHNREVFGDLLGVTDDGLAGLEKAGVP